MLDFLKSLFTPQKPKKPTRKAVHSHHTGKVAIISADSHSSDPYNDGAMHSMEAVTVLPMWFLENQSFDSVHFAFPSDSLVAPVITSENRTLLMKYVRDICPEPDSSISIYQKLNDPDATVKEISALVSSDPMLAAQILKLVNSASFGVTQEVTSIGRAVTLLGFQNVKSVVLNHSIRRGVSAVESEHSLRIRDHSIMCSSIAYHLAEKVAGVDRFTASTIALLHDMGKLLLPMIKEKGKGINLSMNVPDQVLEALIASVFGELWKLPQSIVKSLEYVSHPYFYTLSAVPGEVRKLTTVISMANLVANAMKFPDGDPLYYVKDEFLLEIRADTSPARWVDGSMAAKIEQFRAVLK